MKDLFSDQSKLYQQARPSYPHSLIVEILKHVKSRAVAWDCGAGSGQFTQCIAPHFKKVIATDLSQAQLEQAPQFENVRYKVSRSEHTNFPDVSFDLTCVAQAIHWFDFDAFYQEVNRTLKSDGLFAVIGYGLLTVQDEEIQELIQHLYFKTLKQHWDAERRYIDEHYQTIPFPFNEIKTPEFDMRFQWNLNQLLDYLNTWSALKHYRKAQQSADNPEIDPLEEFKTACAQRNLDFDQHLFQIRFPILLRLGQKAE